MTFKESGSAWWLVCANLLDNESDAAEYWLQWKSSTPIDEISNSALLLATRLCNKWPDSRSIKFDPRIRGNAKRTFFQNARYLSAINEINLGMDENGTTLAWLRESAFLSGKLDSIDSMPVHRLEALLDTRERMNCKEVLAKLGWKEIESQRSYTRYVNSERLMLYLYSRINPHWTRAMHNNLLALISVDGSGTGVLMDLCSQMQLKRTATDWFRVFESMFLLQKLKAGGKWKPLTEMGQEYFVIVPLLEIYCCLKEVVPNHSQINVQTSVEESELHSAYAHFMTNASLLNKIKYHIARYRAIKSVSMDGLNPINYVLATHFDRKSVR
jgi:hypothetical protein